MLRNEQGHALIELVTAAALLGIVCAASGTLIHAQGVVLKNVAERAAVAETLRAARSILVFELQSIARRDLHGVSSDSVSARIFRGAGIVCMTNGSRAALRYTGLREPDADKDSLFVVGGERAIPFRLAVDQTLTCLPRSGEEVIVTSTAQPLREGSLVLLFETGTYSFGNNALRYRRGAEGRQPITDELLDHRRSHFSLRADALRIVMHSHNTAMAEQVVTDTRVPLLNAFPFPSPPPSPSPSASQ